ncbi:MAG: IPT/TIG domain-containing protein [Gallionella sp.]|nr:IPT/TIG domain-containing protein [Gallionella sp.]
MKTKIGLCQFVRPFFVAATLALVFAGCGGGGGGGSGAPVAATLSGVAAVGAPIVNGTISAICAAGSPLTTTTDSTGGWQVTLSSTHTLPCAVQVSGGTINAAANTTPYHTVATTPGTVNVTPLTDLMAANLTGTATPITWFAGLSTAPAPLSSITQTSVDTTLSKLRTALSGLTPLSTINPITTAFTATAGNVSDDVLTALQTAMTSTGVTYASLLNNASAPAFTAPPAGFNTALTNVYTGTTSGSAVASFSGAYNLTANDGTTANVTFDSAGNVTACSVGTVVICSGNLTLNSTTGAASFQVSGNDGLNPVDTTASVMGTIGTNGRVSGSYSGNSTTDGAFSGTFSGSKAGAPTMQYDTITVAGLSRLNNLNPPVGELVVTTLDPGLLVSVPVDTLKITSDGTYTFPTPITAFPRGKRIDYQPETVDDVTGKIIKAACKFSKGRQWHVDPYTEQLITEETSDIYCFESPCGSILTLGQAPAPKGLTVIRNPDSTVSFSWQKDSWAYDYRIYYGTDQNVVSTDPLTGFAVFQNQVTMPQAPMAVPQNANYYYAITSRYTSPADLDDCQSSASAAVMAGAAAPTISGISPTSGAVGTVVTITGTDFDTISANNRVKFNGTQATVTAATATSLTVTVPVGATTGQVSVATVGGSAASSFTVTTAAPTLTFSAAPFAFWGDTLSSWFLSGSPGEMLAPVFRTSLYYQGERYITTSATATRWSARWQGTNYTPTLKLYYYTDPAPVVPLYTGPEQPVEYLYIEIDNTKIQDFPAASPFPSLHTVCFVVGSIPASVGITTGSTPCSNLGITFSRTGGTATFNSTVMYPEATDLNLITTKAPPTNMSGTVTFAPF